MPPRSESISDSLSKDPKERVNLLLRHEQELLARARQRLSALAAELGLPESACHVESGNVKTQIVRAARERQVDLIVIGARERHGPSILVNLTEDTVLHAAPCDVLAMRTGPRT